MADVDDSYDIPVDQCPHSAASTIDSQIKTHTNLQTGVTTKFVRFKTKPWFEGQGQGKGGQKVNTENKPSKDRVGGNFNASNTSAVGWKSKRNDFSDIGDDFVKPAGSVKRGRQYFKK
jgi:hypothetical protein